MPADGRELWQDDGPKYPFSSPQILLDLDLPPDLLLHLSLNNLRLMQTFESDDEVGRCLGPRQVYPTELPFPKRSTNGESRQ